MPPQNPTGLDCTVGQMPEPTAAIEVAQLVREFRKGPRAVDGIDLQVARGEIYGFLGPNGAGKSTTVLMLTTLLPPTSGHAKVGGYDIVRQGTHVRESIGAALQEVLARRPQSFSEFKKQCADLKIVLDESDALEKRKRQMLADLKVQFGDDPYVGGLFDELRTMEDLSDKMEPVWRGMIACSGILVSAPSSKQDAYHTICVDPAQQQISLIVPEISAAVQKLQNDIQRFGVSLPPDVLQAIAQ